MRNLIDKLYKEGILDRQEFKLLLTNCSGNENAEYLFERAREVSHKYYERKIFIRGLIEYSNYCRNDCYYCGIRRSNGNTKRYRLSKDDILSCCDNGYRLGFRTFVLQSGEDPWYTDDVLTDIVSAIRLKYPNCAITLSSGEKSYDAYLRFFNAGANRYLLRHETAASEHYQKIHPPELNAENRKQCLYNLKKIGYQTGAGFMVGSPYQTLDNVIEDLIFIKELKPHMVGIGPFIPHKNTPFAGYPHGSVELTLALISVIRLMLPNVLIPSTTALASINQEGRERGILAGANVVMPNLSPMQARENYTIYDNKLHSGREAAEGMEYLKIQMGKIGYEIVVDRGDYREFTKVHRAKNESDREVKVRYGF